MPKPVTMQRFCSLAGNIPYKFKEFVIHTETGTFPSYAFSSCKSASWVLPCLLEITLLQQGINNLSVEESMIVVYRMQ